MKTIYTKKTGNAILVSDEDYETLSKFTWHVSCRGYAQTNVPKEGGGYRTIFMHRMLGIEVPEGMQIDHINGTKLDNRRENLRVCTGEENCRTKRRPNPCGFRGVSERPNGKYQASIRNGKSRHYLGVYDTPQEASAAFQGAAKVLYGDFQPIDAIQAVQP